MNRLPRRIPIIAALLLIAAAAHLASARPEFPVALRTLGVAGGALVRASVPAAFAQQTLEFKAVPPESLDVPEPPEAPVPPLRIRSGDIMRVGSDITIAEDQEVQGDVLAIRGDVNVDGRVSGNVVSMGGDVRLSSTARVDGDVVCMGGKLHEEPGATVGGQRVTALDPEGRRSFAPRRIRIEPDWDDEGASGKLIFYLVMLGLVWSLCKIAPGSTGAALASLKARPAASLGLGFLIALLFVPSLIALALVIAILCITIIGIPLALIALLGYFVFFALLVLWGYAVGAAGLGERLLERRGETNPSLTRAAVAGVIAIGGLAIIGSALKWLDFLPLMGLLSGLVAATVVLGTIVLTSMGAGAWMHTEFTTGTLGRWWRGSSGRMRRTPPPEGPATPPPSGGTPPWGGGPPPVTPPAPEAPSSASTPPASPPPAQVTPPDPSRYAPPPQSPGFGRPAGTPEREPGGGEGPPAPV